jgi:hypothetical protein
MIAMSLNYAQLNAQLCRGNIYNIEYVLPGALDQVELIINGKRVYPVSYPKSYKEYIQISNCDSATQTIWQLNMPVINKKSGILVHALWPNYVGYIPIKTFVMHDSTAEIILNAYTKQNILKGYKYRLVNILTSTLDSLEEGEYYYNTESGCIYIWSNGLPKVEIKTGYSSSANIIDSPIIHDNLSKLLRMNKSIITGSNLTISGCIFENFNGRGLVLNGSSNICIENCIFSNISDSGIMITNSTNISIKNCQFIDCCRINYKHGVDLYIDNKSQQIYINNCIFRSSPKSGIQINTYNVIVRNCKFISNSWFGHYSGAITICTDGGVTNNGNTTSSILLENNTFDNIKSSLNMIVGGISINSLNNIESVVISNNKFTNLDNSIIIKNNISDNQLKCITYNNNTSDIPNDNFANNIINTNISPNKYSANMSSDNIDDFNNDFNSLNSDLNGLNTTNIDDFNNLNSFNLEDLSSNKNSMLDDYNDMSYEPVSEPVVVQPVAEPVVVQPVAEPVVQPVTEPVVVQLVTEPVVVQPVAEPVVVQPVAEPVVVQPVPDNKPKIYIRRW